MDTTTAVETAQAPSTFDVLSFVEATAYPTDTVVLYADVKSAAEYVRLVNERAKEEATTKNGSFESDYQAERDAEIEKLGEKIKASSIVFDLRGMPPGIVQELIKMPEGETDSAESEQARDDKLIAATIIDIKNAEGVSDNRGVYTQEDVAKLRAFLKEGEFGKLVKAVGEVNFNAMVFDQATDAGFSGRRADVA